MASRFVFLPEGAQYPTSAFASLGKNTVGRMFLQYDAASAETAFWTAIAPENFAGPANVIVTYFTASTSGAVVYTANLETSVGVATNETWSAGGTVTSSVPGTANTAATFSISLPNVPSAGSYFRLRLRRDAAATGDTATLDCNVLSVEFKDAV